MKNINLNWIWKALVIVGVIALILLFFKCRNEKEVVPNKVEVTTPTVNGSFDAVKPTQKDLMTEPYAAKTEPKAVSTVGGHETASNIDTKKANIEPSNVQYIAQLEAENKKLKLDYLNASTALQLAMYNKSIQLKEFSNSFDDKNITAIMSGLVRGEVQSMKLDYTLKPQTISAPVKETYLRFLIGAGVGVNKDLNQGVLKANLSVQNARGNIYRGSFEKIGNQQFYLAEYDFSILNLKK